MAADLSVIRTVLRTFYKPCPRSMQAGEVAAAAAAIDRMVDAAERVTRTSRGAAIDDLAGGR